MQYQLLLKYLLITAVLLSVLYFVPSPRLSNKTIVNLALIIILSLCIVDTFFYRLFTNRENMEPVSSSESCNLTFKEPHQYNYTSVEEDQLKTGLDYNHNLPGYYLINNGKYSSDGIDYNKVEELICESKYNDLYNQHNFNIIWSPHTHVGKARGYLNPDKITE
jgi:hypothetical protein